MVFAHAADSAERAREVAAPAMARVVGALVGAAPPDGGPLYDAMQERGTGLKVVSGNAAMVSAISPRSTTAPGSIQWRSRASSSLCGMKIGRSADVTAWTTSLPTGPVRRYP